MARYADRRLRVLPRVRRVWRHAPAEGGRLLRVLFIRIRAVSADSGEQQRRLLPPSAPGQSKPGPATAFPPEACMSDSTRPALPTSPAPAERRAATWADSAGVLGAVFAALCCMGAPVIVSVLAAIGLSWLR